MGSFLSGFYLIAGPFVSAMANRWGFRPITIAGSFIASAAFAISSQANGLPYLYLTFGLIGGIGFSMIYIPGWRHFLICSSFSNNKPFPFDFKKKF